MTESVPHVASHPAAGGVSGQQALGPAAGIEGQWGLYPRGQRVGHTAGRVRLHDRLLVKVPVIC